MLKKNDEITVEIERFGGEMGIAHLDGMTLFVENALPGERVLARAQRVEKSCAFLKTLSVLAPAPGRVAPPCPYYEKCGGCVCQHMAYPLSLEMKRERVQDALRRIGGLSLPVPPVLGMDSPWHYRNKASMPVGGERGRAQIGFYAPRSHRIVPVESCLIAREESNQVAAVFQRWMEKFQIEPYQEASRQGLIRHIMSRVSRRGQVMAVVVAARERVPHERELTAMLLSGVPGLASVYLNINKRGDNVILGPESRLLYGAERLEDTLCGLTYQLSPLSFFQVNPVQTEKLYQLALDYAGLTGGELAADLYCGAGTISLLLAQKARHVVGIEIVPQAILDAEENARRNGVENVEFHAAAAEKLLPQLVEKGLRPQVVVLDPPRKGCEEAVLAAIAQAAPERVVYVSCDPATLARDAKFLCDHGFQALRCQSVDMFCQTGHVETVVLLSRETNPLTVEVRMEVETGEVKEHPTYKRIQEYVQEKYGFKVHTAYIAEVKRMVGLDMHKAPNAVEQRKHEYHPCPPEKVEAIKDALRHFGLVAK